MKPSNALFLGKNDITASRLKLLLKQYFNLLNDSQEDKFHVIFTCYEHFEENSKTQQFLENVSQETVKIVILKNHHCPIELSVLDKKGFDYYLSPPFSLEKIEDLCRFIKKKCGCNDKTV